MQGASVGSGWDPVRGSFWQFPEIGGWRGEEGRVEVGDERREWRSDGGGHGMGNVALCSGLLVPRGQTLAVVG